MKTANELEYMFFDELKTYNQTNFHTLATSDVTQNDGKIRKCYSSVITRYFIFREKHEELSEAELNVLYFKLKLDMIAQYFATYPDSDVGVLVAFQNELKTYVESSKSDSTLDEDEVTEQTAEVITNEQTTTKV